MGYHARVLTGRVTLRRDAQKELTDDPEDVQQS